MLYLRVYSVRRHISVYVGALRFVDLQCIYVFREELEGAAGRTRRELNGMEPASDRNERGRMAGKL